MDFIFLFLVIIICVVFIFFFIAKNKYTKFDENSGEVKSRLSSEILEMIEDSSNLTQINKTRVELKRADISPLTKDCLYSLLKKKRLLY